MADWVTISSLASAGGTLALAVATFASVRSARRDAGGSQAVAEIGDGVIYLAMSLRNVGTGIGVLQGWYLWPDLEVLRADQETFANRHPELQEFRRQTRDLYIPPGDIGLWQGALRDASEDVYKTLAKTIAAEGGFVLDLCYTDHVGGQRSISRFLVTGGHDRWMVGVARHWSLDRIGPR